MTDDKRLTSGGIGHGLGEAVHGTDGRQAELGATLKNSRVAKGLELADVAELTHVRKEYLRALEEGRYADLPEDVYTRNFVRLFAQAVGIEPEAALQSYQAERQKAGGLSTLELRLEKERKGEPPPKRKTSSSSGRGTGWRIGPALPTLLLVMALVALAVWGFNRLLFRTDRGPVQTLGQSTVAPPVTAPGSSGANEAGQPAASQGAGGPGAPADAEPRTVLISIISDPPGATVSIDSFVLPGTTPITDAPVTARNGRIFNVSLDGYQTLEQAVDLLENQTINVTLAPVTAAGDPAAPGAAAAGDAPEVVAGSGELVIAVRASTWLEVYRGTARNQGERLVYRTADPGETFRFDLPVYVHVGNAAGVDVTVGDVQVGAMGSSGAVVGRAFTGQ